MSKWTETIPLDAARRELNGKLRGARNATMLEVLGSPRAHYTSDCLDPTNPDLIKLVVREDVGPFKAKGLKPAVDTLRAIFLEVKDEHPDIHDLLGNMGMLCCRYVRGSASAISNHSWGTAIDLTIDGVLDKRGDGRAQRGLLAIYPIFNKHGFYWGAAFPTEDAMHFEASDQLIREWQKAGRLISRTPIVQDSVVEFGDRGPEVVEVQRRLALAISGEIAADGIFGTATRASVMEFQRRNALKITGIVDDATLTRLRQSAPDIP
ncbi:peptidoglycan-binding protein [Methylobacterium sp. BTF04]|uniref:peptidoglycan-binding protein n=1 Tax=Methylobacterium sp. BTF04 TaxID=2708300 RepID=UPI0013D4D9E1|nr:peptidoglycan-binding protein [Methylobacterium sp. BTF04]NEU10704.1 peptidoglycan-binding protein [Methylobacterium sp. BTF04]